MLLARRSMRSASPQAYPCGRSRLRNRPQTEIERAAHEIQAILALHQDVVFADLNLKLNLLWVSLRPSQGAISELVAAIRLRIPEAVLVAHHTDSI